MDPLHNITALLIGTGEFSFSEGAISPADALVRGYLDFGNIVAFTPEANLNKEEHQGSYRGVRRADKTVVTENGFSYKIRLDEWNKKNLEILFSASATTGFTQTVLSAAAGAVLGFTANPAKIGYWYDLRKSDGSRLFDVTSVTITGKVEGTDFVIDQKLGRIRFLTAQAADLTPTITAPAIVSGSSGSFLGMTPLQDPVKQGYGRLYVYDQDDNNKLVLTHLDFSCEVTMDSANEIDGTAFTDLTLDIKITNDVGIVYLRDANQNAGVPG
jgi:hypothetical protein